MAWYCPKTLISGSNNYMDFVSFVQRWCYLPIFMYGWCRVTVCHAKMEIESWWPWFWPVGWYAASHRSAICRWHLAFCTIGLEVGKLLDSLVGGGSCVERWQNCYFDKSNSTAFNNHNWSWNHIEGSAMQCRAELVGLHVNCVRIGTKIFGLAIPSPASGKGVSCQHMDFGAPGEFQFLSVSAILMLLFHRLRALQVGIVPFTTNTYQPWTFIFANFGRSIAGPSAAHWLDTRMAWDPARLEWTGPPMSFLMPWDSSIRHSRPAQP